MANPLEISPKQARHLALSGQAIDYSATPWCGIAGLFHRITLIIKI